MWGKEGQPDPRGISRFDIEGTDEVTTIPNSLSVVRRMAVISSVPSMPFNATVLAVESLVFVWVHVKYREVAHMILSGVLGLLMAFIACGRMVLQPVF
jgi:hypothetical protein